ncbi:MAG: cytochrome C [Candidatus Eisenbacteria bacterium]
MDGGFKDREHLFRAAGLLVGLVVAFIVVRGLFVPPGFGAYGHYRSGALDDIRAREVNFAGQKACAECHEDVLDAKAAGAHKSVHCEACHDALAKHAVAPDELEPKLPDVKTLCVRCHQTSVARPKSFPQVDPEDHAGESPCTDCHTPHAPSIS